MDLTPKFSKAELKKYIDGQLAKIQEFVYNEFLFIGLEFVRTARINADFTDRTGNLRSSIGFLILKNGQVLKEDFEEAEAGTERTPGKIKGRDYALEVAKDFQGFVLVVVAGMQYAAAVEARGFDVLTSSAFAAEDEIKKSIEKIKRAFSK